jgi:hypothetical protein
MLTEYCQGSDVAIFTWNGTRGESLIFNYATGGTVSGLESPLYTNRVEINGATSYKIVRPDIRNGTQVNRQAVLIKFDQAVWNQNPSYDGGTIYEAGGTCVNGELYATYLTVAYSQKNNLLLERIPLLTYDIVDDHEIIYHKIILRDIANGQIVSQVWRPLPSSFTPGSSFPTALLPNPNQLSEIANCFDDFTINTLCCTTMRTTLAPSLPYNRQLYLVQVYNSAATLISTIARLEPPLSVESRNAVSEPKTYRVDKIPNEEVVFPIGNGNCVEIYKKNVITGIVTLVNSFCGLGSSPPAYAVSCGIETCPPNTCQVDCGTHYCCYNSQGISIFNYMK